MASAWITIFTETWAGVATSDLRGFLFLSHTTTEYGWLNPGATSASRSTRTTAWTPVSWLFGPSMRTLAGVTVVALGCSWNPGGSALTRSIETGTVVVPSSSTVTVTELGATIVMLGSELLT